jgi:hypothetical protein
MMSKCFPVLLVIAVLVMSVPLCQSSSVSEVCARSGNAGRGAAVHGPRATPAAATGAPAYVSV